MFKRISSIFASARTATISNNSPADVRRFDRIADAEAAVQSARSAAQAGRLTGEQVMAAASAYVGNDANDQNLLSKVGLPANATSGYEGARSPADALLEFADRAENPTALRMVAGCLPNEWLPAGEWRLR